MKIPEDTTPASPNDAYKTDSWPIDADGELYDGNNLLALVRKGESPFQEWWEVELLLTEMKEALGAEVVDIPKVYFSCSNYGFNIKLANGAEIAALLFNSDVNMPNFDRGRSYEELVHGFKFEAAVFELLLEERACKTSKLLYYRFPVLHPGPRLEKPRDILGRRLALFEKVGGATVSMDQSWCLSVAQKTSFLKQAAHLRAALFNYPLPLDFAEKWMLHCHFNQLFDFEKVEVAPTREFCVALLTARIGDVFRELSDIIGQGSEKANAEPVAHAARQSLLNLAPHIFPEDTNESGLYRLVLEHRDVWIHDMTVTVNDETDTVNVTSHLDWEFGYIVPAILSDSNICAIVRLVTNEDAEPAVDTQYWSEASSEQQAECMASSKLYHKALFDHAPGHKEAIRAGKDARHIWFALQEYGGEDIEAYFGELGAWAEDRMKELGVN